MDNPSRNDAAVAVPLSNIRMDEEASRTQLRETVNEETVGQYAEAMDRGDVFPLIDLVEAGDGTYLIADGWHRVKARGQLGKSRVRAIVHSVPDGVEPLDVAIKMALKANSTHGLHLTRGDQQKKAQAALLHPDYQGWSLRALEAETGVGKSTLGRVRTALIRKGELAHPVFGSEMPEWVPEEHASVFVLNSQFTDETEMERVYGYIEQLVPQGDPRDWQWDPEEAQVIHGGLIEGKKVAFEIEDNPISQGMPSKWSKVAESDDGEDEDHDNTGTGSNWMDLSQEERDRIIAANERRELHKAAKRIKDRDDKELNRAVNTLMKRADEPGLWDDLRALILAGGPASEHTDVDTEEDF